MKTENGKHTPGPWRVSRHDALRYTWHVNAGPAGYSQKRVAIVPGDSSADCAEANAALIAAAPDMLEALRSAAAFAEQWVGANEGSMLADAREAMLAKARAAIRKATGGEGGGV